MSAPARDPLADEVIDRGGVPRDQYGRAKLVPLGGGERVPYTSMSTLAAQLNAYVQALHEWEIIKAVQGVAMSRELTAIAASSKYSTRIGDNDTGRNREEKLIMMDVIDKGKLLSGAHEKAMWGTAFHRFVEDRDPLGEPPEDMAEDIEAFHRALDLLGIKILATEVFVVNELLGAAGSFDYALHVPWLDGVVIGDSKTGKLKPDQCEIQLFGYAGSEIYDRDTDERIPFVDAFGMPANLEVGLVPHTPPMAKRTDLWPVDLVAGRGRAILARDVHRSNAEARKRYGKKVWAPLDVEQIAQSRARNAMQGASMAGPTVTEFRADLKRIHQQFRDVWTTDLTDYGKHLLAKVEADNG